jgi:hypothetical protein
MIRRINMNKEEKVKQGKKNRKSGAAFELKVRKDLEEKGWVVAKWTNNVEFELCDVNMYGPSIIEEGKIGKLIPAKRKYNPFTKRPMAEGTGFPDFIAFELGAPSDNVINLDFLLTKEKCFLYSGAYHIIGVEVKSNGYLDKEENEKCKWLIENKIFSKIIIASKGTKRGDILYKEFKYEKE